MGKWTPLAYGRRLPFTNARQMPLTHGRRMMHLGDASLSGNVLITRATPHKSRPCSVSLSISPGMLAKLHPLVMSTALTSHQKPSAVHWRFVRQSGLYLLR
jgi:hypothetical protein